MPSTLHADMENVLLIVLTICTLLQQSVRKYIYYVYYKFSSLCSNL